MWRIVRKGALLETTNQSDAEAAAAAAAAPPGGWRLRVWLLIFGACLVVPALGFAAILLERHWASQQRETEQRLEQVATDLAGDLDRFLENMIATASVIAESSDFSPQRLPRLHEQASNWLSPLGLYLVYRDAGGQQLMNTRVPWGTKLPGEQLPEIDAAVRATLKPHVSDVFRGAVAAQAIVTITVPVLSGGRLSGFLHLSIDPRVLRELARGQNLPGHWDTVIADGKGVVIARLHDDGADGQAPAMRAEAMSRVAGWRVSARVPLSVAGEPLVAEMWWVVGATLVMLGLMLVLAFTVARFIARPIRDIAGLATLVESEQVPPPLASPLREANEVAASLRLATQRLQQRAGDLRDTLDRFHLALRGADIVVFAQDLNRRLTWVSDSSGNYPSDIIGQREEDLLPAGSQSEAIALKRLTLVSGKPQDRELKVGQGEAARYFRVRLEPVTGEAGEVVGLLGVSSEVTALKKSEQHSAFLAAELAHRSKNLLSVVQAIAGETLRSGSLESFVERFTSRIKALAVLQDLLLAGLETGVELNELVRAQLAPFLAGPPQRLSLDGPPVRLRSRAANALGLALHELATNAAKYGALSAQTGRISLSWWFEGNASKHRFRLCWRESGGPPVQPPDRAGFGQQVLVDMTQAALQAHVSLDFDADGVVWRVDAPADSVEFTA